MKHLLFASAVLFSAGLFAQDNIVAATHTDSNEKMVTYSLKEVVINAPGEILLGEFNDKSKKGQGLGEDAYYFENSIGEGAVLKAFLFKVYRARYSTKLYLRFYEKKEFMQDIYVDNDTISYASYIPGNEIKTKEITINIEPGQKGTVKIDLSGYDIIMPQNGLFVSLELMGYFDEKGNKAKGIKYKDITRINFHPTTTDNYCALAQVQGRNETFWINYNKSIKADFKYGFKHEPSKSILVAPNFGLKVARK